MAAAIRVITSSRGECSVRSSRREASARIQIRAPARRADLSVSATETNLDYPPAASRPAPPGASGPSRSRSRARRRSRSLAPVDEVHALPAEYRRGARRGRRDDGRPIQVQDEAEPVGPALATKPLGVLVHFRLRVLQVIGERALLAGVTSARHDEPHEPARRHRRPGPERSAFRSIPTSSRRSRSLGLTARRLRPHQDRVNLWTTLWPAASDPGCPLRYTQRHYQQKGPSVVLDHGVLPKPRVAGSIPAGALHHRLCGCARIDPGKQAQNRWPANFFERDRT
jgi:hypothetical protein